MEADPASGQFLGRLVFGRSRIAFSPTGREQVHLVPPLGQGAAQLERVDAPSMRAGIGVSTAV